MNRFILITAVLTFLGGCASLPEAGRRMDCETVQEMASEEGAVQKCTVLESAEPSWDLHEVWGGSRSLL